MLVGATYLSGNEIYAKSPLKYSSKKVARITHVKKAYNILEWFGGCGFIKFGNKVLKVKGQNDYLIVTEKKCITPKKFKKYLLKYFDRSKTKELLKSDSFKFYKGKVYVNSGARGANIMYMSTKYKIIKQTKKKRVIRAISSYWENYDSRPKIISKRKDYYQQKKVNGKWVFSVISLPY